MRWAACLAALLVATNGASASAMDMAQALAAARANNPDLAVVVADGDAAAVCQQTRALSAYHADHAARLRQAAAQAALEASAVSARSVAEEVAAAVRPLVDRLDSETWLADAERGKAEAGRDVLVALCRRQAVWGDAACDGLFTP